ncbi:MAG: hypothetical protein E7425_14055 [Ruminococcaceae bacterium]|nr:hypothetical protein [Oscillospiraceae bacterium]
MQKKILTARLLALCLALLFAASVLPAPALASYEYSLVKGTLEEFNRGVFFFGTTKYFGDTNYNTSDFTYTAADKTLTLIRDVYTLKSTLTEAFLLCNDSVEGMKITLSKPVTIYVEPGVVGQMNYQEAIFINAKTTIDTNGNRLSIVGEDWIGAFEEAKRTGIRPEYNMELGRRCSVVSTGIFVQDPCDLTIQNSDIEIISALGIFCETAKVGYRVYDFESDPEFEFGTKDK